MKKIPFYGVVAVTLVLGLCALAAMAPEMSTAANFDLGEFATAMGVMVPAQARGILSVRADAPADVKALLDGLQKDWSDFKATVEEKDKELARKFDDYVTTEKLERINTSVGDLQAAIDDANAKLAAIALGAGDDRPAADPEYTTVFKSYFTRGDIQASLNKGASDEGGYLSPVEWDRTITDKLVEVSPMRQIATVQRISTGGFSKLFNLRGTASGWVGETAARAETATPTFGSLTYTPGEIYANPAGTQALLDDAEIDLEAWLAGEVETEFALQEGLAFISGDGTNKPTGFLTYVTGGANAGTHPLGAVALKTAASATDLASDELQDLIYLLPSAYTQNARWVMNRATQGAVRKLKDGQGNYLWQPAFTAGQPATISGYPVTEMPGMPNIATTTLPIAFGDFRRGYLIVDRTGVRVLRDPFTNKPYVQFYTTKRVGGGLLNPETIKVLKMA